MSSEGFLNAATAPDFLVIGAQKSGTTTVIRLLGGHPDVWVAGEEAHYFSHRWDRGPEWYAQSFRGANRRYVGEKSPSYLSHPDAAKRIVGAVPSVRLIAILRDPIDRAYSHYWHNRRLDREPLSFAAAIEAEEQRVASASPRDAERAGYVAGGRYDEHLARFDGLFPGDQLLVTLHDDLNSDSSSVRAQLAAFLGLATPIPAPRASVQNPYVEYRSHRARRLARKLPRPIAAAVFRVNTRRTDYPAMDPGVRRELATRFAPTKEAISARLGRELRWASP